MSNVPVKIMGWKSCDEVRFDLGPILQCQIRVAKLKVLRTLLLLLLEVWGVVLEAWDMKPTYKKSWAGNFLMYYSDLTLGTSFKVR